MIESLDRDGRGIARINGKTIFVEGGLPLEDVEVRVFERKPTYEIAEVTRVLQASSSRVTPRCTYYGTCGGCSMQHADTPTQVAVKQRVVEDAFSRIGKVSPETILPSIHGPSWGYRHRARLSVRHVAKKGGALVGFRERRSSYVADMTSCEVLPEHLSRLLVPLRELIGGLAAFDKIPQIEIAVGERVTVLVFRNLEPISNADGNALRIFADRHGVQIWLQPKGPDTAAPFHPLDAPSLDYFLPEFDVRIGFLPTDFTQVNHAMNTALVGRAVRLLDPQPGDAIADLFCGLGNFTLPLARRGALVHGFEGAASLVKRAMENAARNGLSIEFTVANLFEPAQIPSLDGYHKLLIDPPRDGAAALVSSLSAQRGPSRIVYVSCDPATLARDAQTLTQDKGYRLKAAGIANMFPHTSHVESIALFER